MGLSSCGCSVANEFSTAMAGVGYRLKRANVWRSKERYAQKKTELELVAQSYGRTTDFVV